MLKQLKWSSILTSIAFIIVGLLLVVFPDVSASVLATILGLGVILYGIINFVTYFLLDVRDSLYRNEFLVGIVCFIIGGLIIFKKEWLMSLVPIIFGLAIMISGFVKLQKAVVAMRIGFHSYIGYLLMAIISIVLGFIIMFFMGGDTAANILFITIGIGLMFSGISDLISTCVLAGKMNAFIDQFKEDNGIIDAEVHEKDEENL